VFIQGFVVASLRPINVLHGAFASPYISFSFGLLMDREQFLPELKVSLPQ